MSDFYGVDPKLLNFCVEEGCSLDGKHYRDENVPLRLARPGDINYIKPSWK